MFAILRGAGSHSRRLATGTLAAKASRRSAKDIPQQSTLFFGSKGVQDVPLALVEAPSPNLLGSKPNYSFLEMVKTQVGANVATLTVGQVPLAL